MDRLSGIWPESQCVVTVQTGTHHGAAAMKHISMTALSIVAAMLPAFAQDTVPYAYRPPTTGDTFVPTLGDIMGAT